VPNSIQASEPQVLHPSMVSEDVDGDEVGLRPLPELTPEIVLDMLNDQNTSRSGFIAMIFTILERSPALSSLLVLVASFVLILVLRN